MLEKKTWKKAREEFKRAKVARWEALNSTAPISRWERIF